MSQLLLGIGFGLVTASIIALGTVGMSLQFSVTRGINFAHGELLTVGAYAAYSVSHVTSNLLLQALAALAAGMALAWAINRGLFRPFRRHGPGILIVVTVAASLLVQSVLESIFSGNYVDYTSPSGGSYQVGPFRWTGVDIATMAAAAVVLVALHFFIQYTKFGKAQRAVADDIALARVSGIPAERVIAVTWLIDGAVAGLGGLFLALQVGSFVPTLGFTYLLVIFAAAIVGGIGRMYGAMLGALIIGVVMETSAMYIPPDYKQSVAFLVLILALFVRPQGIIRALSEAPAR